MEVKCSFWSNRSSAIGGKYLSTGDVIEIVIFSSISFSCLCVGVEKTNSRLTQGWRNLVWV